MKNVSRRRPSPSMVPRARRRALSYANVTSTLALVLVLGAGSAWAAKHYVITSTNQIKPSVIKKLHGANGKNGTNGTNGTNGATGASGVISGYVVLHGSTNTSVPALQSAVGEEACPSGDVVLGGGASVVGSNATNNPLTMEESQPDTSSNAWAITMVNNMSSTQQFDVWAVCAKVAS
ncbi:MAG TPA: hypothetical protein VHM72_01335 [Solirubrobacteraceae bacterium]|nr:hypothetical protein [Solirubrobacteraceae bacterium]